MKQNITNPKSHRMYLVIIFAILILVFAGIIAILGDHFSFFDQGDTDIEIKHSDLRGAGLEIVETKNPYYVQVKMNYIEISSYLDSQINSKEDLVTFAQSNNYLLDEHGTSLVSQDEKCLQDTIFQKQFCVTESLKYFGENSIAVTLSGYKEDHGIESVEEEGHEE